MKIVRIYKVPIEVMITTFQDPWYHICNAFGDSIQCFDSTLLELLVHGFGQVNGTVHTIWSLIITPIFNILHQNVFEGKFMSELSKIISYDQVWLCQWYWHDQKWSHQWWLCRISSGGNKLGTILLGRILTHK